LTVTVIPFVPTAEPEDRLEVNESVLALSAMVNDGGTVAETTTLSSEIISIPKVVALSVPAVITAVVVPVAVGLAVMALPESTPQYDELAEKAVSEAYVIKPVLALPEAVGVPGKLLAAPVIVLQLILLKVVETVCEALTAPFEPPVYDGKLIVSPVPVLLAEVVKAKITAEAPPEFMLVSITWAWLTNAADAICQ